MGSDGRAVGQVRTEGVVWVLTKGREAGPCGRNVRWVRAEEPESLFGFMSGLPERSSSDLLMGKSLGSFAANDVVFRTNFRLIRKKQKIRTQAGKGRQASRRSRQKGRVGRRGCTQEGGKRLQAL